MIRKIILFLHAGMAMVVFWFIRQLLPELLAFLLMKSNFPDTVVLMLFNGGSYLITLLIAFPAFVFVLRAFPFDFSWKPESRLKTGQHAVYLFISSIPILVSLGTEVFLYRNGSLSIGDVMLTKPQDILLKLMFGCFLMPVMEEIMFRGILLNKLSVCGTRYAIVVSTLFFVIGHDNPVNMLITILPGLLYSYVAVKTKGICYGVIYHITINLMGSLILPFLIFKLIPLLF